MAAVHTWLSRCSYIGHVTMKMCKNIDVLITSPLELLVQNKL